MNTTTIEHLQCHYLVAEEHPAPLAVRSRLDTIAHNHLAEVCHKWLTQLLDPADPAIWLIRQIHVG